MRMRLLPLTAAVLVVAFITLAEARPQPQLKRDVKRLENDVSKRARNYRGSYDDKKREVLRVLRYLMSKRDNEDGDDIWQNDDLGLSSLFEENQGSDDGSGDDENDNWSTESTGTGSVWDSSEEDGGSDDGTDDDENDNWSTESTGTGSVWDSSEEDGGSDDGTDDDKKREILRMLRYLKSKRDNEDGDDIWEEEDLGLGNLFASSEEDEGSDDGSGDEENDNLSTESTGTGSVWDSSEEDGGSDDGTDVAIKTEVLRVLRYLTSKRDNEDGDDIWEEEDLGLGKLFASSEEDEGSDDGSGDDENDNWSTELTGIGNLWDSSEEDGGSDDGSDDAIKTEVQRVLRYLKSRS